MHASERRGRQGKKYLGVLRNRLGDPFAADEAGANHLQGVPIVQIATGLTV